MKTKLFIAVLLFTMLGQAQAYVEIIRDAEVYLGTSTYLLDDDKDLENPLVSVDLGFERPINKNWSWELWWSRYESDSEIVDSSSTTKRIYQGGLYHFNEGNLRYFARGGFAHEKVKALSGEVLDDPGETRRWSKRSDTTFDLGVGLKKYTSSQWLWRGELATLYNFDREHFDLAARISVGYSFGRKYIRAVDIPESEPEPAPPPPPPPAPEPEPVDSDLDGVFDDKDQCPGTDPRFKVDEVGCAIMLTENVSIEMDVKFRSGRSDLSYEYYPEIQKVADFMRQFDKTVVTVEGHTDSVGSAKYNRELSQRRAESVRNALIVEFGLLEERVIAIGYGEDKPIADNATEEGRATNRRVVAVIESTVEKAQEKN